MSYRPICSYIIITTKTEKWAKLGKQLYRLPSFGIDVIDDVGLDETSPSYLAMR
jgi:hypothetical protein